MGFRMWEILIIPKRKFGSHPNTILGCMLRVNGTALRKVCGCMLTAYWLIALQTVCILRARFGGRSHICRSPVSTAFPMRRQIIEHSKGRWTRYAYGTLPARRIPFVAAYMENFRARKTV